MGRKNSLETKLDIILNLDDEGKTIPYSVYKASEARHDLREHRYHTIIILLIVLLVLSNAAWIWYECQFVDIVTTVEQQSEGDANYIGNNGSINYGTTEDNHKATSKETHEIK